MLTLDVPSVEFYTDHFFNFPGGKLELEHSLESVSKWESKYKRPFSSKEEKTDEETLDYIRMMTLNEVDPLIYNALTSEDYEKIGAYVNDSQTATWFSNQDSKPSFEIITAERIYYAMIREGIPFSCEKWHINRLLTLIRVCQESNSPKKMSREEVMRRNKEINAQRRAELHTRG